VIEVRPAPAEHYAWIASRAGLVAGSEFRAIEAVAGDRILAMVGYDGWTPNSCIMHVAIDEPIAIRRLIGPTFQLPFERLNRGVVLASILSTNGPSLKFVRRLGFEKLGAIRDGYAVGVDLVVFQMRREKCPYIRR
jgi:RimJ/RimL family protein N-acetyltransferase